MCLDQKKPMSLLRQNHWSMLNHDFNKYWKAFDNEIGGLYSDLRMDFVETDTEYTVTAHTPGVKKEDIKVIFENDTLTISVTRHTTSESDEARVHFRECSQKSMSRSIRFEHGKIDYKNISARYTDGALEITLDKNKGHDSENSVDVKIH